MPLSRSRVIQGIVILVGLVFATRLFILQVVHTDSRLAAEKNIIQRIEMEPYRGIIYDRYGAILVCNEPIYDLMVIPAYVQDMDTLAFCQHFQISPSTFAQALQKARQYACTRPSVLIKGIEHAVWARMQCRLVDYPGFFARVRLVRKYPRAILGSTLGYLGEISPAALQADTTRSYRQGNLVGISGLEKTYEALLRGKRGVAYRITDVQGTDKGSFQGGALDIPPCAGQDLTTTLDSALQHYGERLMQNKIGSIVVLQPYTGEVLALVSTPTYDPNQLTGRHCKAYFTALEKDSTAPLFNRSITATYPPGSIFKPIQALIALQAGVIQAHNTHGCHRTVINCHPHPTPVDLHKAIQYSCNSYFSHVFGKILNNNTASATHTDIRLGLARWGRYVRQFGLAQLLGIDLAHEKPGFVPDVAFYDKCYGPQGWHTSTIRSLDIGQGELLLTPLQMANVAAIMANRGHYYTPHLIRDSMETGGCIVPPQKHEVEIAKTYFDGVARAMRDVVVAGSGWRADIKGLSVCGKTGTVENLHGQDHAVFIGFAPLHEPQIAIAVYVENAGWGARAATAIAGLMIEKYLHGEVRRHSMERYVLNNHFADGPVSRPKDLD